MAEEKNKLESRKFLVWITWLVLALSLIIICTMFLFVVKSSEKFTEIANIAIEFIKQILGWFFIISSVYLGVNVTQKVGLAIADIFTSKKDEEK